MFQVSSQDHTHLVSYHGKGIRRGGTQKKKVRREINRVDWTGVYRLKEASGEQGHVESCLKCHHRCSNDAFELYKTEANAIKCRAIVGITYSDMPCDVFL